MPRPKLDKIVVSEPGINYFKPAGVRLRDLEEVAITVEEFEAVRLKDLQEFDQEEAAEKMGISQPTFHRLIIGARKKLADALTNGKAIKIEGGNYTFSRGKGRQGKGGFR